MAARSTMEEEFREFVAARSGALLRTAYLLAGDWATAEDLLQTALTKTYLAWKRLGEIEAVEPYTRRVLVNTATSWWRRRWHGERPTEILPERPAPDRLAEQLERDALWQHVKALPARQRAVLVLRFYEDLSEAQTAATLGISVGTVKSQASRALAALRQRLGDEGVDAPVRRRVPAQRRSRRPAGASAGEGAGAAAGQVAPAIAGATPDQAAADPADPLVADPAQPQTADPLVADPIDPLVAESALPPAGRPAGVFVPDPVPAGSNGSGSAVGQRISSPLPESLAAPAAGLEAG